jgi:anti-sigma B factor antagonist
MIEMESRGEIDVVRVKGNLDIEQALELENELNSHIDKERKLFIIDLGNVNYMSSSGIRVFIAIMRRLEPMKGRIVLANLSPGAMNILKLVQMRDVFEIINKVDDAVKVLTK